MARVRPPLAHHRALRRHPVLHRADPIRAFITLARSIPSRHDLSSSLRLLGTVGEPINPEAWVWY